MLKTLQNGPFPAMLWQGNDGFILSDGQRMIATDLDLTLNERLLPPTVALDELAQTLDWLMITHGHEDHFSTATVRHLLKGNRCRFIIPESCREKAAAIPGLKARTVFVRPGDRPAPDGIPLECLRAVHGHIGGTVYSGASMLDCGYRFTFGGLNFYQPGDTVLLEEHLEMHGVDVLFISPTEHNLGVENAVRLIRMLTPKKIILQHHSTYREQPDNLFWAHGYVPELLAALNDEERVCCMVPDQNTVIQL
ncbi:MAG: MBL fold metallo-hydrolase [Clostridia bacterium]|nr:MBL fold metallo-hydrolase [Clostridia bacterium]